MAKRHLGLGKAAKAKKQKVEPEASETSNELTVELNEETDADDELAQLKALWKTYRESEKENKLVVNGIIHECDRLLRNAGEGEKVQELPDYFHLVYALALAELANHHVDDKSKVKEFYDAALERVDVGLEKYPESIESKFAKSKLLVNQIPLQYISELEIESKVGKKFPDLSTFLDEALETYEAAETISNETNAYEMFNEETLEILQAVDDLLDIVDNFGRDISEGDNEDDEPVDLLKTHPVYGIRETDKYNQWWRDHSIVFLSGVDKGIEKAGDEISEDHPLASLRREVCKRIGQSYLQESEIPSGVFTALMYDEDVRGEEELHGLTGPQAQEIAQELISTALKYFEWAKDEEEPESWVRIAEAKISLGNMYEVDSAEQEECYAEAEKILNKANNVTNGKYLDVLENLLG